MVAVREVKAIKKRQLAQREQLWPGSSPWLWDRHANNGFTTMPKTMPNILQIMDDMSDGKPVSSTYLGLWCQTWDNNSIANVSKQMELARVAGFTSQRAIYTWSQRMKILHELRFIDIKPGASGSISNVLIWNPHFIIRGHHERKTPGMVEAHYNALIERALDIGANDMLIDGMPEAPTVPIMPEAPGAPFAAASKIDIAAE